MSRVGSHSSPHSPPTLGLELRASQGVDVSHPSDTDQHCGDGPVPVRRGGSTKVESVGEHRAQQEPRHGRPRDTSPHEKVVGDNGRHGSPRTNVNVDRLVGDDGGVLQCVVVNDTDDAVEGDGRIELLLGEWRGGRHGGGEWWGGATLEGIGAPLRSPATSADDPPNKPPRPGSAPAPLQWEAAAAHPSTREQRPSRS